MIGERLPASRWSVGNQLGTDRQSTCDGLVTVYNCTKVNRRLKTVLGLSATTATGRRPVTNQSPTSRRPPCDHAKTFFNRFGHRVVSLAASKTSRDQIVLATFLWLLQTVYDQSVCAWRSPNKLPVTVQYNNGGKAVADRLQAMRDRGFRKICYGLLHDTVLSEPVSVVWFI